jgi:photosystem II stability/assembly factor-like uncharacterized protein
VFCLTRSLLSNCLLSAWLVAAVAAFASPATGQQLNPQHLTQLRYRFIGPDGNRAIAVAGVPGDPMVSYIGAASGGLWKTTDGGTTWDPIFDDQPVSSIGSIAIAPSDPNVLWVGTGETFVIRPAHSVGDGVYRSTDAGKTWTNVGLGRTGRIGRMVVDPRNPDVAFACALGHTHGPQHDRGVYRTVDGGATWEQVLFVNENTGCSDLAIDPTNPRILYATTWEVYINTWGLNSGGMGSGVYKSVDGGTTWTRLANGLPDHPIGKTAVAVAQSDPDRVYVLVEDSSPGLYRSDNAGLSWTLVNQNHTMAERAPYYTRIAVSPDNEDHIYFICVRFSMSIDGGHSLMERPPRAGGDNHDMWIDPLNPDRYMVAHDGGVAMTLNRGRTVQQVVPPIAQMYHVAVDNQIPYNVYGNRQDGYSYRGPSNSRSGRIPLGLWISVGGCESGYATPDPVDNNIVWSGCYDGGLERWDARTGQVRNVRRWPEAGYGWPPAELKYRWHWNFAFAISPHDHNRVYVGSQYVSVTTDGGHSWTDISPDLTLNLKDHQQNSGGVATDNLMTYDGSLIFSINESPVEEGVIWVGTNDGQVQITRDGGASWTNVTRHIPALPPWGTVANIAASRFEAGTAYLTVDMHQMGDFDPYVYKATEFGRRFERIDHGIPRSMLSFAHEVYEDPVRPGMLYLGVDNAVYVTLDDGDHWTQLQAGLPPAPAYGVVVQEHFHDLVVGTYGRGFYILDDITPLRNMTPEVLQSDIHLFPPRDAYRFQPISDVRSESNGLNAGRNPPYGASINYWVGDTVAGKSKIEIVDSDGAVIRTLDAPKAPGINRVWWDLRYEDIRRARLRSQPPGKEHVEFNDEGWRALNSWDLDLNGGQSGPLAIPGVYTVRLTLGEREFTQPLTVLKDPHSTGTEPDIRAQVAMSLTMRDELNEVVDMINDVEWLRYQVDGLQARYRGDTTAAAVVEASESLERQAISVEGHLYDINLTGAREDAFRAPMKLFGRLSALASDVGANGSDFSPTTQQVEVHAILRQRLEEARELFRTLIDTAAPALQRMISERGLPDIISMREPK